MPHAYKEGEEPQKQAESQRRVKGKHLGSATISIAGQGSTWPLPAPSRESRRWLTEPGAGGLSARLTLRNAGAPAERGQSGVGKEQLAVAQWVTPLQPAAGQKWRTRNPEEWVKAGLL